MDFSSLAHDLGDEIITGYVLNPKSPYGNEEYVSLDLLNENYKDCKDLDEAITKTKSKGIKLFFGYLKEEELLS